MMSYIDNYILNHASIPLRYFAGKSQETSPGFWITNATLTPAIADGFAVAFTFKRKSYNEFKWKRNIKKTLPTLLMSDSLNSSR